MSFRLPIDQEVELAVLGPNDAQKLFELTQQNIHHLKEWFMWAHQIKNVADSASFIDESRQKLKSNRAFDAGIWLSGTLVGAIGFHPINWDNRFVEIGYWIAKPFQGRGLMTRSVTAILQYAYQELQLNRVEICVAVQNQRSRAVAERLGFQLEGFEREGQFLNGEYVDVACYSLLAREWFANVHPLPSPKEASPLIARAG